MKQLLDAKFDPLTEKVGEIASKLGELAAKVKPANQLPSTSTFLEGAVLNSYL